MTLRARWSALALATALAAALAVVGCAGELATPGEPLRLLGVTLPSAYEGASFEAPLRPTGGLRPYRFEVVDGALPPGLDLEQGRIVGTPTAQGRFAFTVEVQDANLNRTVQRLELTVAPLPPPVVTVDVPTTPLQRATELRLRFTSGRAWRGGQASLTWDAEAFVLDPASVRTGGRDVIAVWDTGPGRLRVDLAVVGEPLSASADLLRFTLTPVEAAPLWLDLEIVSFAAGGPTEDLQRLGATAGARPSLDAAGDEAAPDPFDTPFDDPLEDFLLDDEVDEDDDRDDEGSGDER